MWSEHSFRRIIPGTILMVILEKWRPVGRLLKKPKSDASRIWTETARPKAGRGVRREKREKVTAGENDAGLKSGQWSVVEDAGWWGGGERGPCWATGAGAYLGRSCQLSSELDHCIDVYFLWGRCYRLSEGHDTLHPEIGNRVR